MLFLKCIIILDRRPNSHASIRGVFRGGGGGHSPPLELFSPPLESPPPPCGCPAATNSLAPLFFFTYSKFGPPWQKSCIQPCLNKISLFFVRLSSFLVKSLYVGLSIVFPGKKHQTINNSKNRPLLVLLAFHGKDIGQNCSIKCSKYKSMPIYARFHKQWSISLKVLLQ